MKKPIIVNDNGIGFLGLLTILFVAFKLLGIIDWPWLLVFAPIWIWIPIMFLVIIIAVAIVFIAEGIKKLKRKK